MSTQQTPLITITENKTFTTDRIRDAVIIVIFAIVFLACVVSLKVLWDNKHNYAHEKRVAMAGGAMVVGGISLATVVGSGIMLQSNMYPTRAAENTTTRAA